nr:NTP transferase domain-containing protein [uncultured Methanobrevibacter sp.]
MNGQKLYSCIVLSGGMSRRMGQDKGSMIIQEKPMILHILERLNYKINDAVIVLNDSHYLISIVKVILKAILIIHWNLLKMRLRKKARYQES